MNFVVLKEHFAYLSHVPIAWKKALHLMDHKFGIHYQTNLKK